MKMEKSLVVAMGIGLFTVFMIWLIITQIWNR